MKIEPSNYDAEYLAGINDSLKLTDQRGNGDGNVTSDEFFAKQMQVYKNVFGNDTTIFGQATKLAQAQEDIVKEYAGEDGILSAEECADCINSEEYAKTLEQYWQLRSEMEQRQGAEFFLGAVDNSGNQDGNADAEEVYSKIVDIYSNTFAEDVKLKAKSMEIAKMQYELTKEYAGEDGILNVTEYQQLLASDEFIKLNDQYWGLREQQE